MNRYKIKMRNAISGKDSVDVIHADDQAMLRKSLEEMGFALVEILEEASITLEVGPPPNLNGIEELGIGIDERAVAQAQIQPQIPQPGQPMQPMAPVVQLPPPVEVEFVDNGISYRIINGVAYKKDWVELDPREYKFVRKETKKEIKNEDVLIYKRDWVKVVEDTK